MPSKILCLAFNNAIAAEWRQRILQNRWPNKPPTEEQSAILSAVEEILRSGDLARAIQAHACAGTGKTDTLFRILQLASQVLGRSYLPIVEEKIDKTGRPYQMSDSIMTAHALGRRVWLARGLKLDSFFGTSNYLLSDIAKEMGLFKRPGEDSKPIGPAVISLVEKARLAGIVPGDRGSPLLEDTDQNWEEVAARYDILTSAEIITSARGVLEKSISIAKEARTHQFKGKDKKTHSRTTIRIDQGGMLYLPVVFPGGTPWWDFQPDLLLTDEMQDFSPLMQQMVGLLMKKKGTLLIGAGDPRQAIYSFAGADSEAFSRMRERFEMEVYSLSISFRCAHAIIREAQTIEPMIQAAPWASEGKVGHFHNGQLKWSNGEINELESGQIPIASLPSTILCRNNAPIARLAIHCLTSEIPRPVAILGRAEMIPLLKSTHSEGLGREGTVTPLPIYQVNLLSHVAAVEKKRPAAASAVRDRADVLLAIASRIRETRGDNAPASLILDWLDRLYPEDGTELPANGILFSTVHKSKGLEWPNVGLLDPGLIGKFAKTEIDEESERNLLYVAITRAAESLLYFNSEDVEGMPAKREN